ncbi:uncharacterized protein [Spinacia oleracea]|uniref:Uncharacterized protein n=1 Tax=Spinacia oleracea TaxID=3562 RepID=A0ABM3QJ91_SPIOL|nr:uncharacterized protein LOC130459844 [Spinacia oleracea]XP_056683427.1 uncharacterized protein LOC130459844 [Spinacia oleracea]
MLQWFREKRKKNSIFLILNISGVWVDDSVEPFSVVPETPMDDLFDPETPKAYVFDPMAIVRESPSPSAYYSEEFGEWVIPDTPDREIVSTSTLSRKRKGDGKGNTDGKDKVKSHKRGKVSTDDVFEMLKGYVPSLERNMMGNSSDSE